MLFLRRKRPDTGPVLPVFKQFWSNNSGNPVLTTGAGHVAGDKLLAIGSQGASGTIPTAVFGGATLLHGAAHSGGGQSAAIYLLEATASNHTIAWTGANGMRAVWNLGQDAVVDVVHPTYGTGTAFDIDAQPGMAEDCLILAYVVTAGAQTSFDTSAVALTGLTTRGTPKLTASATWAGDSDVAYYDAFNPAAGSLDTTAAKWTTLVVSIRGA